MKMCFILFTVFYFIVIHVFPLQPPFMVVHYACKCLNYPPLGYFTNCSSQHIASVHRVALVRLVYGLSVVGVSVLWTAMTSYGCELQSHQRKMKKQSAPCWCGWYCAVHQGMGWDSGGGGWLVGGQVGVQESWSIPSCRWPSLRTALSTLKPVLTTKQTAYTQTKQHIWRDYTLQHWLRLEKIVVWELFDSIVHYDPHTECFAIWWFSYVITEQQLGRTLQKIVMYKIWHFIDNNLQIAWIK